MAGTPGACSQVFCHPIRCMPVMRYRQRHRKKRRKRKLPKGGGRLFPPGCGRPCEHRQVPAVHVVHVREGAPASVHRQSGGHSCFACRDVYPQYELCTSLWSFYWCCSWTVPPPDIGGVGFGSSPTLDTKHTIYELSSERGCPDSAAPMCCGGVCVAMSCGGGGFPPDGAYFSAWCSVRPMTGIYFFNYFQYQDDVWFVCMLNGWFSSNDEVYADNYIYFRFKLQGRSEKWELYLYGDMTIKVDRDRVEVLPIGVPPSRFFTQLGNGSHTIYGLCLPSVRGMGMNMPLAVPVSSGKFSGTCVSTALLWNLTRCPSQSLWQEAPSMLLQLSCSRALRWQTALSSRLQCAARVLASPCRVMVDVSLLTVLFFA